MRSTSLNDLQSIEQPLGGFTSHRGIYVRVHKPIDRGHFHFIYGIYKHVTSEEHCKFKHQGKEYAGFKCVKADWCIPMEHVCNQLPNCPDESDEDQQMCQGMPQPFIIVPCKLVITTEMAANIKLFYNNFSIKMWVNPKMSKSISSLIVPFLSIIIIGTIYRSKYLSLLLHIL